MWFGTNDGLNKFDGKEWVYYRVDTEKSNGLLSNHITSLVAGKNGEMWIGSSNAGVFKYNPLQDNFTNYVKGLGTNQIVSLLIDDGNELYVSCEKFGIFKFNKNLERFISQPQLGFRKINQYYSIIKIGNTTYSAPLGNGLIENESGKSAHYQLDVRNSIFPGHTFNCMFYDGKRTIWLGAWDNGLYSFDILTKELKLVIVLGNKELSPSENEISTIISIENKLLLGTKKNGCYLFNIENKELKNLPHNFINKSSISSNNILCSYKDRNNNIWIGTDNGISIYDPFNNQFELKQLSNKSSNEDFNDKVNAIYSKNNTLVICTNKHLYISDKDGELKEHFIPENPIYYAAFINKYGDLIIGTNKTAFIARPPYSSFNKFNTFYKINPKSKLGFDFYSLDATRIIAIEEDTINGIPVYIMSIYGYGTGIFSQNKLSGSLFLLENRNAFENFMQKFFKNKKGELFVLGNVHGILKGFNFRNPKLLNEILNGEANYKDIGDARGWSYFGAKKDYASLNKPNAVADMLQLNDEEYLLSTTDQGLVHFNERKSIFTKITSNHTALEGIKQDKLGRIWIVTNGGFDVYFPNKNTWQRIPQQAGLPEKGIHGYITSANDSTWMVGSFGSYIQFNPNKYQFNDIQPQIKITHLNIFENNSDSLLTEQEIKLNYNQNYFTFQFTSFNTTSNENIQFSYQLIGLDKRWVLAGKRNTASYTNLDAGDYIFQVKATNSIGVNSKIATIKIKIIPPFYKTTWFYIMLIFLFIFIVFIIIRLRINQIKREQVIVLNAEFSAQEKERKRLAQDLHDDLGTRMSALKLFIGSLSSHLISSEEGKSIKSNAEKLLDESIKDLRALLNNLSPDTVSNFGYYKAIEDLAIRINNMNALQVEIIKTGKEFRFEKEKELTIYRITQELINNSIKHASCNKITINITFNKSELSIFYEDDGKGFNLSEKSQGFGLQNISNRVGLIKGKISWDSFPGRGTRVIIDLIV
jgi:signal transduction histidine kinase/ligand-binding sensor domain-containing protein